MTIQVINPLAAALAHYEDELTETLTAAGAAVDVVRFSEPSAGRSRSTWVAEYLQALRSASTVRPDRLLLTWPVLGYLDVPLARVLARGSRPALIVHDPVALVGAVGYGAVARRLASAFGRAVDLLVHTEAARVEAVRQGIGIDWVLPHPMSAPAPRADRNTTRGKRVVVLGQYKPDRDVDALAALAVTAPADWELRIRGRGWPAIRGWDVEDRFLSEDEFEAEVEAADAVLIPYRRFYQSGVAVRCLERGIPCVGPRESSLRDLLGDVPWLVRDGDWHRAVTQAVEASPTAIHARAVERYETTAASWRSWVLES